MIRPVSAPIAKTTKAKISNSHNSLSTAMPPAIAAGGRGALRELSTAASLTLSAVSPPRILAACQPHEKGLAGSRELAADERRVIAAL